MARLAAVAAVLTVVACGDDATPIVPPDAAPTGMAAVAVAHYDYTLDLETRAAEARLTVRLLAPGNCIALPSRAPMLDLGSVTLGGAPAVATTDGVTLTTCGAGWPAGTELVLTARMTQPLETWGGSQVGYSVRADGVGQLFYLISWVGGCDRFGPCDPAPSAFARYRFTVRHRSGVQALCPGRITAGETVTVCEFDQPGGPTYSTFGIVASTTWQTRELGTWGGVRAVLHDRPASGMAALIDPGYHQAFLAWMVERFGPYPYGDQLRIATGSTYWSGFEHPGNIVLDTGLARPGGGSSYARPVGHVLNHEIAHQWAGDQTTLASTYDFVWKEAMAEYLAFVYEDDTEPAVALVTARAWKSFAYGAAYFPVPEEAPALLDYYGEVYGPGPMILFRQLEVLTSRGQVIDAIKMLLGQERAVSVDQVQAALETTTGLDLDNYFDTWIRGRGAPAWPTFRVAIVGAGLTQQVQVTETTAGGVHGCDFAVELRGAPGESHKVMIRRGVNGVAIATELAGVAWTVTSTVLDPDAQCLAYAEAATLVTPRHPPGWSPWRASYRPQ